MDPLFLPLVPCTAAVVAGDEREKVYMVWLPTAVTVGWG